MSNTTNPRVGERAITPDETIQVGSTVRVVGGFEDGMVGTVIGGGCYNLSIMGGQVPAYWLLSTHHGIVGPFTEVALDEAATPN